MTASTSSSQRNKTNSLVIRSAVVAALGGLLFGFDTAVISGTTENLREVFHLSEFSLGFTVATALIGTIVGAMSAGRPADRLGRKKVLGIIGILYTVSALGSALVSNWYLFMLFRFIGGVGVGGASVVSPIYTAEISPARLRGRLVGLVQFNVVLGILLAYMSNFVLAKVFDYSVAWRWMFGVEAVPAVIFIVLALFIPESPRWLLGQSRDHEAREIIARLTRSHDEAESELADIQRAIREDSSLGTAPFFVARNRKVILLAIAIAAFNQLSGINAVMYYAPDIFRMAGAQNDTAFLSSIAVGAMNLVATMTALTVIDKFGRRRLMVVGSIGYLVSLGPSPPCSSWRGTPRNSPEAPPSSSWAVCSCSSRPTPSARDRSSGSSSPRSSPAASAPAARPWDPSPTGSSRPSSPGASPRSPAGSAGAGRSPCSSCACWGSSSGC